MKLEVLYLSEAVKYAQRYKFSYGSHGRSRKRVHDARPVVLVLAKWTHPTTGNRLVSGLLDSALDDDERGLIRQYLGQIQKEAARGKSGIQALCKGNLEGLTPGEANMLRSIFYKAYRNYREPLMRGKSSIRLSYHI